MTRLHDAAERGDATAIRELAPAADDVNITATKMEVTALMKASEEGHLAAVEALLA